MTDDTKDLQELADVPTPVVTMSGATYNLAPLKPDDIATAAKFIIAERRKELIDGCRKDGIPLPDSVLAEALAKISCTPVAMSDLFNHWEGRLKLLHLSMVRGGHNMPYVKFRQSLDPIDHNDLLDSLARISSLKREDKDGDAPLTSTSEPSEAQNGESSSPGSATTTD